MQQGGRAQYIGITIQVNASVILDDEKSVEVDGEMIVVQHLVNYHLKLPNSR